MRTESEIDDTMRGRMNYPYAGFRTYDTIGDRDLFGVGLEGTGAMVTKYHDRARQLPIGGYTVSGRNTSPTSVLKPIIAPPASESG